MFPGSVCLTTVTRVETIFYSCNVGKIHSIIHNQNVLASRSWQTDQFPFQLRNVACQENEPCRNESIISFLQETPQPKQEVMQSWTQITHLTHDCHVPTAAPDQRPRDVFCPNNKQALSGVSIHRRYWQTQTESAALLFNLHGKTDKTYVMCVTQTRRLKSRLQKLEWPAPLKTDLPCCGCLIIKTWQQKGCGERERDSLTIPMSLSLESLTANHKTHSLGHRYSSSSRN